MGEKLIPANTTLTLSKPISWPEKLPFAVSSQPFAIVPADIAKENKRNEAATPEETEYEKQLLDEDDLNLRGPYASIGSGITVKKPSAATTPTPNIARSTVYTTTYYIHSFDGKLLAEYDATGTCVKDYIYLGNKLLAEYYPATDKYYYYTSDQINSTRVITDSTGTVVYSAAFDPFGGKQIEWVNTYQPSLKFSGKERESNKNEMDYFGARYYDHLRYRFISVDPVINKEGHLEEPWGRPFLSYCNFDRSPVKSRHGKN